jgi:hypothetical protein
MAIYFLIRVNETYKRKGYVESDSLPTCYYASVSELFMFRAESSLIQSSCRFFIRVSVPYEISKVNFA